MTPQTTRASAWRELAQWITDGELPDVVEIGFNPLSSKSLSVEVDDIDAFHAWCKAFGFSYGEPSENVFGDKLVISWWDWWNGWQTSVTLRAPAADYGIPVEGGGVAGPDGDAGSATAPAESTPDVWVPIRRRGTNYHSPGEQRSTTCGRNMFPNGVRLPLAEVEAFGAVPCPRCYGGAA